MKLKHKKTVENKMTLAPSGQYPVVQAEKEMGALTDRLCDDIAKFRELKERMQLDKPELFLLWAPSYYHLAHEVPKLVSMSVRHGGNELLVSQPWKMGDIPDPLDQHAIMKIVGKANFSEWFESVPVVNIHFGTITKSMRAKLVAAVAALVQKFGGSVSTDRKFSATEKFWQGRHTLTLEQNMQLDQTLPPARTVVMKQHNGQATPKAKTAKARASHS